LNELRFEADSSSVGWALSPADGPFGSARANYSYISAPGAVICDGIVISSRSTVPLTLKVYASDGFTTADGLFDLAPAASLASGAATWISFGQPLEGAVTVGDDWIDTDQASDGASSVEVSLPPGGSQTVPFRWVIPADVSPGDHAAGIVTSIANEGGFGSVEVDRRLALRAYFTLGGEFSPEIVISDLRVSAQGSSNPFKSGQLTLSYNLVNSGNARLVPTERIEVSGPGGVGRREVGRQTLPEVLPGSHLERHLTIKGVAPLFRTRIDVQVDALVVAVGAEGAATAAQQTVTVWTVPWSWLGIVVLAVLGAVGATFWLRRRHNPTGTGTES
jgi:hypothetical protein